MSIISDSKRFWPILMANGLYYLLAGMSEAVIAKEVYAVLSPRLISLQSIIGWGGGILLGMAWSRWGKKLFPLLIPMHLAQMVASVAYLIYTEATMNILVYWILGQGMYIFLGGLADKIFDGACAWFFKKPEDRASIDNLEDMVACFAGFLGYFISIIYVPHIRMAIFLKFLATFSWCLGLLIYTVSHKSELELDPPAKEKNSAS